MRSPVVSRLFSIQERPSGHWSRVWLHGTHVRPWFAQLRCRGASCEGGADELARADSCDSLETHRTLISAGASMMVARASCCSCHRCCILPSAHLPTAAGVRITTATRTRPATTGSSLRLFTRGFQLGMRTGRAHKSLRDTFALRRNARAASVPYMFLQSLIPEPRTVR